MQINKGKKIIRYTTEQKPLRPTSSISTEFGNFERQVYPDQYVAGKYVGSLLSAMSMNDVLREATKRVHTQCRNEVTLHAKELDAHNSRWLCRMCGAIVYTHATTLAFL